MHNSIINSRSTPLLLAVLNPAVRKCQQIDATSVTFPSANYASQVLPGVIADVARTLRVPGGAACVDIELHKVLPARHAEIDHHQDSVVITH